VNLRRRANQKSASAASARRYKKIGGGGMKQMSAAAARPAQGSTSMLSLAISSSSLSGFPSPRSADDQQAMFCCRLSELARSTQSFSVCPNELWTVVLHCIVVTWHEVHIFDYLRSIWLQ
jgi:hypothetical protein